MKRPDTISAKIFTLPQLLQKIAQWRLLNQKIVFTNGVFDLLHPGHIRSLSDASLEGDQLIVAVNSDNSVKKLKGDSRPVYNEADRSLILASLVIVDAVIIFHEDTPFELIEAIKPDVLVKGGDYSIDQVVGAKEVIANGGRVVINPLLEGYSTSNLIDRLKNDILSGPY